MLETAKLVESDGFWWTVRPGSGDRMGPGPHEQDIWRLLRSFGAEDAVFIDVGAHVGHFAVRLAGLFSRVVAIEPNPAAVEVLRANLRLNGIGNVTIHPVAAHDTPARLRLWDPFNVMAGPCTRSLAPGDPADPPADCIPSTLFTTDHCIGAFLDETEGLPIDAIMAGSNERVGLMKLDVEGHEAKTLAGAAATIRAHRPTLLIEMHDPMYGPHIRHEVVDQLSQLAYSWCEFSLYQRSKMTPSDMCPYIYAEPAGQNRADEFRRFADHVNKDAASRWISAP
ncbi:MULTISPECIES: FkbM family methyltransferase [unclassified Streptomyces]|uniref:FkbM family methyltransferase n=1 Tax=unclassified Streptomyces TaxID=2593676 RepID=UPI0035E118DB